MNKLGFLPLLLIIGSMGAYAQIPQSSYNQSKLYDNSTANEKPVKVVLANSTDDYISIATERHDLESHLVTLFNDNMTTAFQIVKNKSDNVTLSNDKDAKVGKNSLKINVILQNSSAYIARDYTVNKLQDWSNYNYLNFWFKGQNTQKSIQVDLRDSSWKSAGSYNLVDNSTDWKKVQIPLYSIYNMSMSDVRGFGFHFLKGTKGTFKIDEIQIVSEGVATLFNDDITTVIKTSKQISSDTVTISNSTDAKMGTNSLMVQVTTTNGTASVFRDYTVNKLQDWSNYNYLNFWFKGQNTQKSIQVDLRDPSWKSRGNYNLVDNSTDWKKVQIPLSIYNLDMTKVRGLELLFNGGIKGEFLVDDVTLSISAIEPNLGVMDGTYISGETMSVIGHVKVLESGAAAVTRVFSPSNNVITVKQIVPKSDGTFGFPLSLLNSQFSVGVYRISAQYGALEHKANTSFTILNPQLAETYKGFGIYSVSDTFYAIPQTQGSFDINRIEAGQYSIVLTNDTSDNIKKSIDEIILAVKVPSIQIPMPVVNVTVLKPVPFLVSDNVLLAIWQNRTDLQSAYPEVAQGNLTDLKTWATTIGWKQDPRLAALIPQGEVPEYLVSNETLETTAQSKPNSNFIITLQIVTVAIAIAIGSIFGYKFYRSRKKSPMTTS